MATSSITHNFVFTGTEAEAFANAVEVSFNQVVPEQPIVGRLGTNPAESQAILRKCVARYRANGIL